MSGWVWLEDSEPEFDPFIAVIFGKTAYLFMFIATGLMCMGFESLQNIIPGHPILSFLVLACGAMVMTFLIMQLSLIGPAFSALCCMFLLCVVFGMITGALEPDSVQYFILLTVIFSAISLPLCYINLKWNSGRLCIRGVSCIVAGVLNTLTSAIYILGIRVSWQNCRLPQGDIVIEDKILNRLLEDIIELPPGFASVPGAVVFYIIFTVICLGAFVATIILRDKLS